MLSMYPLSGIIMFGGRADTINQKFHSYIGQQILLALLYLTYININSMVRIQNSSLVCPKVGYLIGYFSICND